MKLIKKFLFAILGLLALISLFILVCAFFPKLAEKTSDLLYKNKNKNNTDYTAVSTVPLTVDTQAVTSDELLAEIKNIGQETTVPAPKKEYSSEQFNTETPAAVKGRGGYIPITENSEQVGDEEAKKLEEQIAYGETGDGLTFDTAFYPYYGMLDDTQKHLYRQIYANAMAVNGIFTPIEAVNPSQLRNVFLAVYNDHPEIFWLDSAYRGRFSRNGACMEIVLQFNHLVDNLSEAKSAFQSAANQILVPTDSMTSEYEVEVFIHDALMEQITYVLQAPLNQSSYSALVNKQTVCAGYARAFQYLMQQAGIPCYYCTGFANQNHAWNIVKLDGEYYNVDVTWDDTDPYTYHFFNKTDADFSATHMREDLSVNLPACNGQKYSNLETAPAESSAEDSLRSLDETGIAESAVLQSIEDYYENCYQQIVACGDSCQFQNVVANESLWLKCYDSYQNDLYSKGYMDRIFTDLNKSQCTVEVQAEKLSDGSYLLTHQINF